MLSMLFLISTFYLSNTFPEFQPVTQIGLPEGAKARLGKGYISGSAKLTRLSQDTSTAGQHSSTAINFAVEIVLMLEGDGTIGALSEEEMQTVCLHEFGHAIGL